MKKPVITTTIAAALLLGGCANMTEGQRQTAQSGGIGAATGAVLGAIAGGGQGAAIGAGVGGALGAGGGYLWSRHMQEQKQAMQAATAGTGVAVTQTTNNELKLDIPSDLSFDTGRSDVKPDLRPVLDRFAQTLQANPVTNVRIVGHTDSTGGDAVNDPLSVERAAAVRSYLIERGVAGTRVTTAGRGSHEPVADNSTVDGRAKNRRVEVFVADQGTAAR
jgi:outer membrane protein OmpA-like peptidoglycan-associated protein